MNQVKEIINPGIDQADIKSIAKNFGTNKIKKVLFIQPPDTDAKTFNYAAGKRGRLYNYPPYGLGILATQLRAINIEVDILNLNFEILKGCQQSNSQKDFLFDEIWKKKTEEKLKEFKPDFIGLTSMFSQSHDILVELSNKINKIDKDVLLGAGGVHITNSVSEKKTFDKFVNELKNLNYFFLYEADLSFINFIKAYNEKKNFDQIGQLIIRYEKDKFFKFVNRLHPTSELLNTVPALDLLQTSELTKWGKIGSFFSLIDKDKKMTTILSNRGCRAQCTFS